MAPSSNAGLVRNPVFAPRIFDHFFDAAGYPVFHVEMVNGAHVQMREHEMPLAVLAVLNSYQETISGVRFNTAVPGWHGIAGIQAHRIDQNGVVYYLVNWDDDYVHPIWRSEVKEREFGDSDILEQYKALHNLP